jgi:hypothetical protein
MSRTLIGRSVWDRALFLRGIDLENSGTPKKAA